MFRAGVDLFSIVKLKRCGRSFSRKHASAMSGRVLRAGGPCAAGTWWRSRPHPWNVDSREISPWQTLGFSFSLQAEHVPEWCRVTLISDDSPPPPPPPRSLPPSPSPCLYFFLWCYLFTLLPLTAVPWSCLGDERLIVFVLAPLFQKVCYWMWMLSSFTLCLPFLFLREGGSCPDQLHFRFYFEKWPNL